MDGFGEVVDGWVLCSRFASFDEAGAVYEAGRTLVFANDVDASVYRIVLAAAAYVVAIGFSEPAPPVMDALLQEWSRGEPTELPVDVLGMLALRHDQFRIPGAKFERRGDAPMRMVIE